jgi:imidazole glycerol-phosphate synthase subunit HisH
MQSVAIIDYGSGNLRSAAKAFERAARESGYTGAIRVTADPKAVLAAERIVLPGVGAFADCMNGLKALPGMIAALTQAVRNDRKPFLGICVGMQLLATRGLEHGTHDGLGWLPGEVRRMAPSDTMLKIPHMGWNELTMRASSDAKPLFEGISAGAHAYFVHSYHFVPNDQSAIAATTDYGGLLVAAVAQGNIAGTQFHPEKSQEAGLRLIANFLRWTPTAGKTP